MKSAARALIVGVLAAVLLGFCSMSASAAPPIPVPTPHHHSLPAGARQVGPEFITNDCNESNTVAVWVDSSMGPDLWCFAGHGSLVNINLTDVYQVATSGQTYGLMTYNLYNIKCNSSGKGEDNLYLTPNVDVDWGSLRIRVCSIQLN